MRLTQYQTRAEPVLVPESVVPPVESWMPQGTVAPASPPQAIGAGVSLVEVVEAPATTTLDWLSVVADPVRRQASTTHVGELSIVDPTLFITQALDWLRETSQPLFDRAPLPILGGSTFQVEPTLFVVQSLDWVFPSPMAPPFPRQAPQPSLVAPPAVYGITSITIQQVSGGMYRVEWTAISSGPFRVYVDGEFYDSTFSRSIMIETDDGATAPIVEVLDDPATVAEAINKPHFDMVWGASDTAVGYRIDQYNGATWDRVGYVRDDGSATYSFVSPALEDDTVHQFRVVPINALGTEGSPTSVSRKIIRHPDPPDVTIAFDDGDGTVTITAN